MATHRFGQDKRRRELAKQLKQEEKRQRRRDRASERPDDVPGEPEAPLPEAPPDNG